MTELQAKTAVENRSNYALIVVELDGTQPSLEYLRRNAMVISDIGYQINDIFLDFQEMTTRKSKLDTGKGGISVNIETQGTRFRISSRIWREKPQTIETFLRDNFTNNEN